ncbi:uncharacterized protein LOC132717685 [Ruditapes philippinarum]|uniref:uncharacterized protein LOC132717685 n=1 Tax=Ruditapes philippinarum TaxID=129788 RepID=UPI00295C1F58|nr:uncharacterized protein LOC132717685 [Ruditapes philippinarum]
MLLKVLFASFALMTVAQGKSKYCCYPDQWEAVEGLMAGSVDDEGHATITNGYVTVSYDAKNQRIYGVDTITTGSVTKVYTFLQLFTEGVQYLIVNKTCTRAKLGAWNNQNCIPDNATLTNQYRLGLNQSIMINDYTYSISNLTYIVSVENKSCAPVVEYNFGDLNGAQLMTGVGVQGITVGIKDPSVFDVPAICKQAPHDQSTLRSVSFTRRR